MLAVKDCQIVFFSFSSEKFNVIYMFERSPYKDLMGGPWWAKMPSTTDNSSKMRAEN